MTSSMKRSSRCDRIVSLLREREELSVEEVCRTFGLSEATVRRDFQAIVKTGRAAKIWGGIRSLNSGFNKMVSSQRRIECFRAEKQRIAAKAATLCQEGDVVFIDGGTTTFELAKWLADRRLRIITNSLLVAHEIDRLRTGAAGAEVFLTGGYLYPQSELLVGPDTVASLARFRADLALISIGGISEEGISNNHPLIVEVQQMMLRNSRKRVLLGDHSKFGKRDFLPQCGWDDFDLFVTDREPAPVYAKALGDRLVIAD